MLKKLLYSCTFIAFTPVLIVLGGAPFNLSTPADQNYQNSKLMEAKFSVEAPIELKLMTYNIANARGFTNNQRERINAVADLLVDLDVDIVGLQEVFIEEDRQFLLEKLSKTELKYASEYPAGFLGNGLVIVSKYPIEESYFHRFKANNPWWKVWEGDWWAGKGIGLAKIKLTNNSYLSFYNVHAQAYRGNQESHDVRYEQFKEASEFLNKASGSNTPVFFVGDFNTEQGAPDYRYAEEHSKLVRLMDMHSDIDHITAIDNPQFTFEVIDTQEIFSTTQATNPPAFYSRAPTPAEFWGLHFAEAKKGENTQISDHPGYVSTIRISNNKNENQKENIL
jgi:sphingomyelin phosphodiesterase 2